MKDGIELFKEEHPSLESYWRSINLFGRNVASYKFAIAKSLLEIAPTGKTELLLTMRIILAMWIIFTLLHYSLISQM